MAKRVCIMSGMTAEIGKFSVFFETLVVIVP